MNILRLYSDICLFKKGPADVPASTALFQLTLFVCFVLGTLSTRIDDGWTISFLASFVTILFTMVIVYVLLQLRGLAYRYQQTMMALAGTSIILEIIGLPIALWMHQIPEAEQSESPVMVLLLLFVFWILMVTAHIFRYALDIKPGIAAVLTVIYFISSILIAELTMSGVA